MVVEFLNNILGTHRHMNGTCIAEKFDLVWCLSHIKRGGANLY